MMDHPDLSGMLVHSSIHHEWQPSTGHVIHIVCSDEPVTVYLNGDRLSAFGTDARGDAPLRPNPLAEAPEPGPMAPTRNLSGPG